MTPGSPPPAPWRGRLVVLLGVVLVALNLRIAVAAVSPILDAVREDVDLSPAQVGVLGTVPLLSFAVFGSLASPLGRRLGLEPTVVLALALSTVGEVARALSSSAPAFLAWSVLALAGMGMGNVLLPPLVKRYFPDRIGVVTAAYAVMLSVSTAVPPLVALPFARAAGWRWAVGAWALLGVVAAVPWLVVIVRSVAARAHVRELLRRVGRGARARGTDPRVAPGGAPGDARLVWRSPLAWAMAVTFAVNSLGTYTVFAWLPEMLADLGLGTEAGGRWLALFAILGLPASLVVPVLTARMRSPFPLVAGFVASWAVGYLGLLLAPAHGTVVWMVLLGLGTSSFPVLLALIGLRTATPGLAVVLSGMVQGVGYALAALGPVSIGLVYEATGGWDAPILVLLGLLVVLLVAGWRACRPEVLGHVEPGPSTTDVRERASRGSPTLER
ncbi:MFS transporter [Cellulomonas uda]|uniref:MFS transporter n=1 Tax=Cellulomonas uda TaxID=1714 RepID=UPI001FD09797|nr:MFS transporter [Cellulomonas uda]NII67309.1 CP family cyanate transporter-like MFS transporter [Cellulomonas uda]